MEIIGCSLKALVTSFVSSPLTARKNALPRKTASRDLYSTRFVCQGVKRPAQLRRRGPVTGVMSDITVPKLPQSAPTTSILLALALSGRLPSETTTKTACFKLTPPEAGNSCSESRCCAQGGRGRVSLVQLLAQREPAVV